MAKAKTKQASESALAKLVKQQSNPLANAQPEQMSPNSDGSMTFNFNDSEDTEQDGEDDNLGPYSTAEGSFYENLVSYISQDELDRLSRKVLDTVETDEQSRSDWMKTIEFGFDLLGVKVEEKNEPFEGACSAQHPLLMESGVKFQSKASNELLPPNGPVKTQILGDATVEKEQTGNRVKAHMNYMVTEQMTEFFPDHERLLLYVPIVGSGFVKTYYDSYLERPVSEFVPADQFIVPNSSPDLFRAARYTHLLFKSENDMQIAFASGFYQEPEDGLGPPAQPKLTIVQKKTQKLMGMEVGLSTNDHVYTLYEQHADFCIDFTDPKMDVRDEDGDYDIASPYVITVDSNSRKIVGIRRNWKEKDEKRCKKVQFTHYGFVPGFNFYCFGYLHLLGNLQLTLTAAMRSLVDAGQFATLQGGFKLKGVRIIDDGTPIHPGQFKEVETALMDINKSIMTLPFKEPSPTLFQMLEYFDSKGQAFADATEQVVADSTNYGPVGTTLALLDASTKFFSAIHKRLHASLKNELKIIADINSETLPDDLEYNLENQTMKISRADYNAEVGITPVSDPNVSSNAHRMAKAQTVLQIAMQTPQLHDMREVLRHVYTDMDLSINIDKILPPPQQAQPQDPITDIITAQQGQPIKAFEGQDHKAHIVLKQAFMQDPMSGANPFMQKVSVQIQANIQEHMVLNFMEQSRAAAQLAQQQNPDNQQQAQDPNAQMELMAQAAQQIAMQNQQQIQQQQQAQQQNDPKSQAELMMAHSVVQDSQTNAQKVQQDGAIKQGELALKAQKLHLDAIKELNKNNIDNKKIEAQTNNIVTTKGLDAVIQGLSVADQKKMQREEYDHQKELAHMQSLAPSNANSVDNGQ